MVDDKYPSQTGRRRFVKGVVGSAALASVGTATAATINTTTNPTGIGGGTTQYMAIENIAGPAPRGMPQIPIRLDDEGYLQGLWPPTVEEEIGGRTVTIAEMELGGKTYSNQWFQYCGVQELPGLDPEGDFDQYLRYAEDPPYQWQQDEVSPGDRAHIDHFSDYESWGNDIGEPGLGKPATLNWRSQGLEPQERMPVQIIRSTRVEEIAGNDQWMEASTREGFMGWLNKCTHFCCAPSGFKTSTYENADNNVYCQCHQSIYDPFSIVELSFVAKPRPGD